ncbi:MAG: 2-oxoacid:ferredoxin oxidoreductase subunit beta [Myxococcales bacterium]|nr:MAG: 2-oxoacid:ferredoxin oxidoreductase subunit beta [Myxococcales bacterium]
MTAKGVPQSKPETTSLSAPLDPSNGGDSERIRKPGDYKSGVKPVWCPGCGHYGALSAFYKAVAACGVDPKDLVIISGIGCSGRFSHFVKGYGFHVLHGRVLPVCQGIAASTKGLLVCGISGDGDALAIGGGHVPHAARRNPNMVYIVLDNSIYGLTKGQFSPTTRERTKTSTSPFGVTEGCLDPLSLFLGYNASFVARGFSANSKQLSEMLAEAIRHPGFAVVHVLSPCVTFAKHQTYDSLSERIRLLPEDFDPSNKVAAFRYAQDQEALYTGIFYRELRPTLQDHHNRAIDEARHDPSAGDFEKLLDSYV